jgi:hypothetical protein
VRTVDNRGNISKMFGIGGCDESASGARVKDSAGIVTSKGGEGGLQQDENTNFRLC